MCAVGGHRHLPATGKVGQLRAADAEPVVRDVLDARAVGEASPPPEPSDTTR
jgi:hypothetical protein